MNASSPPTASAKRDRIVRQRVSSLVMQTQNAGRYQVNFNASGLTSGMYFYRLQATPLNRAAGEGFIEMKKMLLVK